MPSDSTCTLQKAVCVLVQEGEAAQSREREKVWLC